MPSTQDAGKCMWARNLIYSRGYPRPVAGKLYLIGLGLNDEKDITLRGIDAIKDCDSVFAELYTSVLSESAIARLEAMTGKKIELLGREDVEGEKRIIEKADGGKAALLVAGDPMAATTHISLRLAAIDRGIETVIIHNSSVITAAAGALGLQHYKFGRTTSIAFPSGSFLPESAYDVLLENRKSGLHTLLLLDLRPDERMFMSANDGMAILLGIEKKRNGGAFTGRTTACVVACLGSEKPLTKAASVEQLLKEDFGPPPHSIVVPGKLHFMEEEALRKISGLPQ
jgi:diphthine synthase